DGERLGELGELLHRARLDLLDVHAVGVVAFLVVDVLLEDLLVREVHPAPAARIAHAVAAHVAAATAAAAPSASAPAAAALALGGVVHALIRHVGLSSASWVVVGSRPSRRLAPRRIPVLMGWNAAGSRLRSTVRSEPRKWEGVGSRGVPRGPAGSRAVHRPSGRPAGSSGWSPRGLGFGLSSVGRFPKLIKKPDRTPR